MDNLPGDSSSAPNVRAIFIIILACGLLAAAVTFSTRNDQGVTPGEKAKQEKVSNRRKKPFDSVAQNTIIYGAWAGRNAVINAFDLQSGDTNTLAVLNQDVKKISVIDDDHLLYIDGTDGYDRGAKLTLHTISNDSKKTVYEATDSMGIDDYVISPNNQYLAVWEYANGPDDIARGGQSRVSSIRLDTNQKHEIYNETQKDTTPVHYPVAVTNNGTVYLDTWIPNAGKGWANGMTVTSFTGSSKEPIEALKIGTYGTQPVLSPDGRFLAFGGYDPANDPKKGEDARIRAIIRPNTVEIFDTQSKKRQMIATEPNTIYSGVAWDSSTGNLLYSALANKDNFAKSGLYTLNLQSKKATKVNTGRKDKNYRNSYIAALSNNLILTGIKDQAEASIGNLGSRYASPYLNFAVVNATGKETEIDIGHTMIQFIGVKGQNYFGFEEDSSLSSDVSVQSGNKPKKKRKAAPETSECSGFDNLQLCPFYFKVALAPKRQTQQTEPPPPKDPRIPTPEPGQGDSCEDLAERQCMEQGFDAGSESYDDCVWTNKYENTLHVLEGLCELSPLYIYGKPGEKIQVKVNTPVFNAIPNYTTGYDITLEENGLMNIDNKSYKSISYDFIPTLKKITPPVRGIATSREKVATVLKEYAKGLGLNTRETNDLVGTGLRKVTSPYVYISFFDHETSHRLLPLSFTPQPKEYRNIVFYFRLLSEQPPFTPLPPVFPEPIDRSGLTAVEISEIIQ